MTPKTVLVTGARGALGSAVVAKFAQSGCEVIGTVHPGGHRDGSEIRGVRWVEMDVTDASSIRSGLGATRVDALIHCAGGFRFAFADQVSEQDIDYLIDTNLRSGLLLAREIVPGMKERGFGRIVFVSTKSTLAPVAGMSAYTASKAGLNVLTQALAEEVKQHDITVNAVLPTIIDTPANRADMPKANHSSWVPTTELAEIIFSLTQPLSRAINGALLPVPGKV